MIKFLMLFSSKLRTLVENSSSLRKDNFLLLQEYRNLKAENESLKVQLSTYLMGVQRLEKEENRLKEITQ